MDKQKLSTFEAVERIRSRYGLRPGAISFCGLKDKQGRTEQLIAVDGAEVDCQEPDLRLKPLGRTGRPLSAENTTSNRFSVTVRAVTDEDLQELPRAAAEVNRLGVVNYFDSQRFGSLKHGQGYIAKDLLRGDFEAALRNYLAKPSPLDRSDDAKVKEFWRKHWGDWTRRVSVEAAHRYDRVIRSLEGEARGLPPGLPADRRRLPRAAPLHLPELAVERGGAAAAPARAARTALSRCATRPGRCSSTRTRTRRRCAGSAA
jgi:tRNA pseudouridine13 synthase